MTDPSLEVCCRIAETIYALDQDIAAENREEEARAMQIRRNAMLDALCIALEVRSGKSLVLPPDADLVVSTEGARRFRSRQ